MSGDCRSRAYLKRSEMSQNFPSQEEAAECGCVAFIEVEVMPFKKLTLDQTMKVLIIAGVIVSLEKQME